MISDERRLFFRQWQSTLAALLVVLLAAYAQTGHLFSWWGVNPDLAPVALLFLFFFERNVYIILAAILVVIFFLAQPFFWVETGLVLLAFALTTLPKVFGRGCGLTSALTCVAIATILSAAFLGHLWLWQNLRSLVVEIILNCLLGAFIFFLFALLKAKER